MANPFDIVIRLFAKGGDQVAAEFDEAADAGERMGDSLEKSVNNLEKLEAFEGIANAGEKLAGMGQGALELASGWEAASEEGRAIEQRLESILKAQKRLGDLDQIDDAVNRVTVEGHFDDDDSIRNGAVMLASFSVQSEHMNEMMEIGARQARTMGQSVESVATQLGKAYNTGNIAMLAKSGVTMSKQEIAAVKAAYGVSKLAGQMKFMEIVGKAVRDNTVSLNDSLTETQKQANDVARAWDDAQTSLGKGSAEAKANFQAIIGQFVEMAAASPQLLEAAGAVTFYGGQAATAAGSVMSLAGNLGSAVVGAKTLGITGTASMGAFAASCAPVVAALGLIIVTAAAAYKAYTWTQDAIRKSDEEMMNGTGQQKYVYKNAKELSDIYGLFSRHQRKGDSAEDEATKGFAEREKRTKSRQGKTPGGETTIKFEPVVIKNARPARGFS